MSESLLPVRTKDPRPGAVPGPTKLKKFDLFIPDDLVDVEARLAHPDALLENPWNQSI